MPVAAKPKPKPKTEPDPANREGRVFRWLFVICVVMIVGCVSWYHFYGRRPRVVMTVPLVGKGDARRGCWLVSPSEVVVLANGEVRLVCLRNRVQRWSARMPAALKVDEEWQNALNSRFIKLQEWADQLAARRQSLSTPQETREFNDDVAKYQAELAEARAAAAKPPAPKVTPSSSQKSAARSSKRGGAKQVTISAEARALEQRIKRRAEQIAQLEREMKAKQIKAKSQAQEEELKQDGARRDKFLADQIADNQALDKLQGKPEKSGAPGELKSAEIEAILPPKAVLISDVVWVIDANHAAGFEKDSGTLKFEVRFSGPAVDLIECVDGLLVVAAAGPDGRQITRITAGAAPVSLYTAAKVVDRAILDGGTREQVEPNIVEARTVFGGGSNLIRAEVTLVEKKVRRHGENGELEEIDESVRTAVEQGEPGADAIAKLAAADAKRFGRESRIWVDESAYDVTLKRPFETSVPDWTGRMTGRVMLFSTANFDFVTAGSKIVALDRKNQVRWESTLGAPISTQRNDSEWRRIPSPCVEAGDRIDVADGGFLSAFDAKTGAVLWRLPSAGIKKIELDREGYPYVLTDNIPVECVPYSLGYENWGATPLTLKINPQDGKILWQAEHFEELWVTGGDVYAAIESGDANEANADPNAGKKQPTMQFSKLSTRSGAVLWDWHENRIPEAVRVQGKHLMFFFGGELEVVRSLAL